MTVNALFSGKSWPGHAWRSGVLAGFGVWVVIVGFHHEPWFDEAQAWLLARDNGLWDLLTQRVRYEGSPGLWHALLWLAIRAGLPFRWFFAVPAALAIAGAAVVLWRAPFPGYVRVALLASYFFGYQYAVVARSYALDLLLVPLAATWFATRGERPVRYALVLGLIANANAHGFLLAGVLGLELAWQIVRQGRIARAQTGIGLVLGAGLILFALWCAWPAPDNDYFQPQLRGNPLLNIITYFCHAFVDRLELWSWTFQSRIDDFACVIVSFGLLAPVARLVLAGRDRVLCFALFGVLTLFSAMVYAREWHSGMLFLCWMFVLWTQWHNHVAAPVRRNAIIAMMAILSVQAIQTVRTGVWDIGHVYSPGRQAAEAVQAYQATHPHARIDGYGDFAFNIQPWMPGNVFANYHQGDPHIGYVRWDRGEPWMAGSWHPATHLDFWHSVLADRPDLIVASALNRFAVGGYRADLVPGACAAGYALRTTVSGMMIWRGVPMGDETLYLFERQAHGACAHL